MAIATDNEGNNRTSLKVIVQLGWKRWWDANHRKQP